jgi:hypothetical protein
MIDGGPLRPWGETGGFLVLDHVSGNDVSDVLGENVGSEEYVVTLCMGPRCMDVGRSISLLI